MVWTTAQFTQWRPIGCQESVAVTESPSVSITGRSKTILSRPSQNDVLARPGFPDTSTPKVFGLVPDKAVKCSSLMGSRP
jgi:hypothetical protein